MMNKKLNKSLEDKCCIRIETNHVDEDEYNGIVIHLTNKMVVLYVVDNFEVDGVIAIPRNRIKGIRSSKFEKCEDIILRNNGEIKKIKKIKWLSNVTDMKELLGNIKKRKIWPIVEIEHKENVYSLYIGPLKSLRNRKFDIHCYDATGEWEEEYSLSYLDIFKVEFDSKYAHHFNNYMKSI